VRFSADQTRKVFEITLGFGSPCPFEQLEASKPGSYVRVSVNLKFKELGSEA
jgi:hypothetical protein